MIKRQERGTFTNTELSNLGLICDKPLLQGEQRFPNSSFTASDSLKGHNASDARISSGSSWCAPVSDGKHYLQLDLGRLYVIYQLITFGDSTSLRWVTKYSLNYTQSDDLSQWRTVREYPVFALYSL